MPEKPCEHDCDCDMYHDGECFHCDSEQKDAEIAELRAKLDCGKERCAWVGGFCNRHAKEYRFAQEKEIAELRARIEGLAKEWDVGSWNVDENARDAARRLRAALAPKVSHD